MTFDALSGLEIFYPTEGAAETEAEEHAHHLDEEHPAGHGQEIDHVVLHKQDQGIGAPLGRGTV